MKSSKVACRGLRQVPIRKFIHQIGTHLSSSQWNLGKAIGSPLPRGNHVQPHSTERRTVALRAIRYELELHASRPPNRWSRRRNVGDSIGNRSNRRVQTKFMNDNHCSISEQMSMAITLGVDEETMAARNSMTCQRALHSSNHASLVNSTDSRLSAITKTATAHFRWCQSPSIRTRDQCLVHGSREKRSSSLRSRVEHALLSCNDRDRPSCVRSIFCCQIARRTRDCEFIA